MILQTGEGLGNRGVGLVMNRENGGNEDEENGAHDGGRKDERNGRGRVYICVAEFRSYK